MVGFDDLWQVVQIYTPEYVEEISGVPGAQLEAAGYILGTSDRLLSTALQGVYQSNQATASACAINNIALMRGMIGKPGAGVFQMNGQPTVGTSALLWRMQRMQRTPQQLTFVSRPRTIGKRAATESTHFSEITRMMTTCNQCVDACANAMGLTPVLVG